MRIKAVVSYDGTAYGGWQVQKNADSVQAHLEQVLKGITTGNSNICSAGRTDAGVHARAMTVHFDIESSIPPEKLPYVFNTQLPPDIRMLSACAAPEGFHARYSAKGKRYIYRIDNGAHANPLTRLYALHFPYKLDINAMREASRAIMGTHDFAAFCAAGATVKTTIRTVTDITLSRDGDMITISVTGDGFLYNMVRIIAGTLLLSGQHKLSRADVENIINGKKRKAAGFTAAAHGLTLDEVFY